MEIGLSVKYESFFLNCLGTRKRALVFHQNLKCMELNEDFMKINIWWIADVYNVELCPMDELLFVWMSK